MQHWKKTNWKSSENKQRLRKAALHVITNAHLPLCKPTVPVCGRCGGTRCTGSPIPALTSAFGRSSRTGGSCPVLARRCWAPGSPRDPGRPARSPSRCWSAWNEPVCEHRESQQACSHPLTQCITRTSLRQITLSSNNCPFPLRRGQSWCQCSHYSS